MFPHSNRDLTISSPFYHRSVLCEDWYGKVNGIQRAGRVGRTSDGVAIRMLPKSRWCVEFGPPIAVNLCYVTQDVTICSLCILFPFSLQSICKCSVSLLNRCAITLRSLGNRPALKSLCSRSTIAVQSLCNLCAIAMRSFYNRYSIALQSLCNRFATALQSLCNCSAIAL
jgi:hypothetical protein